MSVWQQIEADNYNRVQIATFGHLAPKRSVAHPGFILFSLSAYGDITVLDSEFGDVPDSPWLYEAMNDFAARHVTKKDRDGCAIYRFDGTMTMFKNGSFRFSGKTRPMNTEYARRRRTNPARTSH